MSEVQNTEQLQKTLELIKRTREAINWRTGESWFTAKTAVFLWEIGVITRQEYKDVRHFVREV